MMRFVELTSGNYRHHEAHIMASEELFPEDIRECSETYMEALDRPGVQAYVALYGGEYVGNVVGFPLCDEQRRVLRFDEIDVCQRGLMYLFNIVALPDFKGQGAGRRLLRHFLQSSWEAGFERVGGHFRGNGSLSNFLRLGGRTLATFDDWFDTGEAYTYCEINLAAALELA